MAKTSSYWDKRAIKRMVEAEKQSEAYIERIKSIYNRAYKNIDSEIARIYKNYAKETGLDTQKLKELLTRSETKKTWEQMKKQGLDKYIKENYKARISRLEQIQAQIYAKAKQIYSKEELEQTMCYKGVINDSYLKAIYDTQIGTGYDFAFNKIDNNLLSSILNEKWSGKNYSERIWTNTDILADSISEIVGGALLSGQGIEKTSKQLRDRFNANKYYAERLVRTETNHFHNEADALAYEEMGIKEYVFVATLDNRTSLICQDTDNKKFLYENRQVGVNYPPLHPNCRSTTRGYLGEEMEKTLQRRARDPITGKVELIDNISYKDWISDHKAKNGDNAVKISTVRGNDKPTIKITDLPIELRTSKELKNTQLYIDFINNSENADPKIVKVYSLMGKVKKFDFKVSHAKDSSISYKHTQYIDKIKDFKLTIPNIRHNKDVGNMNTVLHENMHFIDFMSAGNNSNYTSLSKTNLKDIIKNDNGKMSNNIETLFKDFNKATKDITDKITEDYMPKFKELHSKSNKMTFREYKNNFDRLKRLKQDELNYTKRNAIGGGINNLQDIYDALNGGVYRDNGIITYGHGKKYYKNIENRVKEIVANYGALSITRPDLIEMLRVDKPKLVDELDKFMDIIISEYGG